MRVAAADEDSSTTVLAPGARDLCGCRRVRVESPTRVGNCGS